MDEVALEESGHRVGVQVRVVHAADHRHLVAHAPARCAGMVPRRGHDLADRPAPVQGHEDVAQRVAGRVQAHGEGELRPQRGQPPDARDDSRGGDRDVPGAEPEPAEVVQGVDRFEHSVEVQQGLAHAHEHDVREPFAVACQGPGGQPHLIEDLGGLEIATEAQLAGRAERTAHRATGLARDAQGVALAPARSRGVVHEDGLDRDPIVEPVEDLLGRTAIGDHPVIRGQRVVAEGLVERCSQRRRQRRDPGRRVGATAPDRVLDLASTERRLAPVVEPALENVRLQPGDARPLHDSGAARRHPAHRSRSARRTTGGVIGSACRRMPVAAAIALPMAAAPAMTGASPMPFAPNGPSAAGTSTIVVVRAPTSWIRGRA